jgi:hypothetical protein
MARLLSIVLLAGASDEGQTPAIRLTEGTVVRFASVEEGRAALIADDGFTASLSQFDLQCRLKTAKEAGLADWKEFVAGHVQPWDKAESELVVKSIERVSKRLKEFHLPLPVTIVLVHTSGDEEGGAAYTRGAAIVLPTKVLAYPAGQLDRLMLHELFHILSRHDGALRAKLYRIIGFELCEPIEPPPSLAIRRITNPDAPLIDCTIELDGPDGKKYACAPILYAKAQHYEPAQNMTLFQQLTFRLLVVERRAGRWQPALAKGEPVVIDPRQEPAFLDKVGKNTNYIIHPDEILADNFVKLVMGDKDVATPRVIEEMREALK